MPEKSKVINVPGLDEQDGQAIIIGVLEKLNWNIRFATARSVISFTTSNWKKRSDRITIQVKPGQLIVTSTMIHDELLDLRGRNQKNINEFVSALESMKGQISQDDISRWQERLAVLKQETLKAAEEEHRTAQEIEKVMNFSKSNLYVTYAIMAINVAVYIIMVVTTGRVMDFTGPDTIRWGANFGPLTLTGDWWRLLSCVFVHGGIFHLAMNMYALYMAGAYLEPMLGKIRYISAYICTGIAASLASLWWHTEAVPSVGASGAIFGLYGVFLAFLTTRFLPDQIRKGLLSSIAVFVVFNLAYGVKSGIDNAAHVGGLVSGLIIGYLFYLSMRGGKKRALQMVVVAGCTLATVAAAYVYIQRNALDQQTRSKALSDIETLGYDDALRFNEVYNDIVSMQDRALSPLNNRSLSAQELIDSLTNTSLPEWDSAAVAVAQLVKLNVSERSKETARLMAQYITLRRDEAKLRIRLLAENDANAEGQLEAIKMKIDSVVVKLQQP